MMANRDKFRRGFTLIEITLAMGIIAVLGGALFAAMRAATMASSHATASVIPARQAELALDFIRQDLQNAQTPGGLFAGNFEGYQSPPFDDLQFYGTSNGPQHPDCNGEIKQIEITAYTPAGSSTPCLVRRVMRNLTAQTPPNPDEEILCRNVALFSVEYFNGSTWVTTWDSTQEDNTIPAAVQITLQLKAPATEETAGGTTTYVRIISLPCSTAAQDSTVNPGGGNLP